MVFDVVATDYLVDSNNPKALDSTLLSFPIGPVALVGGGENPIIKDGHYVMRIFGKSHEFVVKAIEQQGYCTIIRKLDELV